MNVKFRSWSMALLLYEGLTHNSIRAPDAICPPKDPITISDSTPPGK